MSPHFEPMDSRWFESNMPVKGIPKTEEHKRKISESQRGKERPELIGRPVSEETREKIRIANTGRIRSIESKEKNRQAHLGKKASIETRRKMSESSKGDKCYLWKGGINKINDDIRKSTSYLYWRKECLFRDNFTCQKTGISGGDLAVHHINNFADFPELRFDINNGITLSKNEHKLFHKIYGLRNNTNEQLNEFLNNNI